MTSAAPATTNTETGSYRNRSRSEGQTIVTSNIEHDIRSLESNNVEAVITLDGVQAQGEIISLISATLRPAAVRWNGIET